MLNETHLKPFSPFSSFSAAQLSAALKEVYVTQSKKGTILFKRGKDLADKFFLLEGEVHLINNDYTSEKVIAGEERGLMPLNVDGRTRVSAIAKTPVRYFTINNNELARLLAGPVDPESATAAGDGPALEVSTLDDEQKQDWMGSLLQSPLFDRIPMTQFQELFQKFEALALEKGEYVVKEGEKGDYFYVLASGEAQITDRTGAINVTIKPGSYFGEESLIGSAPRNASVVMTKPGILKRLSADDFSELVKTPVLKYLDSGELIHLDRPFKVLDVRMPIEYRIDHVPGSINVPLARLRTTLPELAHGKTYAVSDQGGSRADIAAYILCQAGFEAFVLKGELASVSSGL